MQNVLFFFSAQNTFSNELGDIKIRILSKNGDTSQRHYD